MFYMVNPSGLPKKKKKKNKSRRRNPELLIVNPYSLEDHDEQKKKAKMAKRKRKSKKSRRRRSKRKNPLARRRRRKNPLDLDSIKARFLGPDLDNVKQAAMMAVGGGLALAVGTAAFGSRLGGGALGKGLVAILSGVVGGVVVSELGKAVAPDVQFIQQLAVAGAMGAMVLGAWAIAQPVVEPWADNINARLGFAGLGAWTKEFDGLGQAYYDEFTSGVAPGMDGYFGQPVIAATDLQSPADNPWIAAEDAAKGTMGAYEPLGDIYNSQRLGSFEAEGLGGFVPETANPRDQQVADEMKHAAGMYGGYEGMGGTLFEPFIDD